MLGDGVVEVSLMIGFIEIFFGIAHLEEVAVLPASERVVPVLALEGSIELWLLNVPESMVWDCLEDSLL